MICPDSNVDCDNPGCRHGGCQGRLPQPPLFRLIERNLPRPQPESRKPLGDETLAA